MERVPHTEIAVGMDASASAWAEQTFAAVDLGDPRRTRLSRVCSVDRHPAPHPPEGYEPLEWLLLCSLPTASLPELKERRDWYACRWMVEVYQDIEKNGCSGEDRRLRTGRRMKACLAVLGLVAVRVYQLRCALDTQPAAPAEQVATAREIEVVRRFLKQDGRRLTVREFVRGVAKLGGCLGRRHDGEPGVRALWHG